MTARSYPLSLVLEWLRTLCGRVGSAPIEGLRLEINGVQAHTGTWRLHELMQSLAEEPQDASIRVLDGSMDCVLRFDAEPKRRSVARLLAQYARRRREEAEAAQ